MVQYPIRVSGESYRGTNARKKSKAAQTNLIARELETFINEKLKAQEEPIYSYSYHEVSGQTGIPLEMVEKLCFSIDCGSGGFTAIKHGLTYEQAMKQYEGA